MPASQKALHLTLQMALPPNENPQNRSRRTDRNRPRLSNHKMALLEKTLSAVSLAAAECLETFKPHAETTLWWYPQTPDGKAIFDKEGKPVKRISGEMQVVIKLRQIAPLSGFVLPAVVKDGIHHKVADLLRSYGQRMLDPQTREQTSYPTIDEGFPIVLQGGFRFLEHQDTGRLFLYAPLFPRGGHKEELALQYDANSGPALREIGQEKIQTLSRARGGLLLSLQFDKWGEATFVRDERTPPGWKATHRRYDQRWLEELKRSKEFQPKRVELFMRGDRIFVNVACEVACKPPVQIKNFMGVALGLQDLITVVVINEAGEIIHQRNWSARIYEQTVFRQLEQFRARGGGEFFQVLETFHYERVAEIVKEATQFDAVIAVETVGVIPKGKYAPGMNRRLSYWPFGKLADMVGYKSELAGLPKPYGGYSALVRGLCSQCGASNRESKQKISLEGPSYYCGNCGTRGNSGINAALNLARRAKELRTKGVVAR